MSELIKPDHKVIYLVPDDVDSWLWCEDPAPSEDTQEDEAIKYIRADEAEEKIERLDSVIKVLHQAILEVDHAQQDGASWYTKGSSGLYQQVRLWINKSYEALKTLKEPKP